MKLPAQFRVIVMPLVLLLLTPIGAAAEELPDGQSITPTAAPGSTFTHLNPGLADFPDFAAGQAVTTAVSPDGKTLLVLTSGYNRNYDSSGNAIAAASSRSRRMGANSTYLAARTTRSTPMH